MKPILFLTVALILNCGHILAESGDSTGESKTISLKSFEMEIPEGWNYETAIQPNEQVVTRIFHPDKEGTVQIGLIISLPKTPTQSRMRLLTNLDSSVVLNWQKWGNFSGYHYEHAEQGKFYRQWWLTNHNRILAVVYSSMTNDESIRGVVDEMVKSLTITL